MLRDGESHHQALAMANRSLQIGTEAIRCRFPVQGGTVSEKQAHLTQPGHFTGRQRRSPAVCQFIGGVGLIEAADTVGSWFIESRWQ